MLTRRLFKIRRRSAALGSIKNLQKYSAASGYYMHPILGKPAVLRHILTRGLGAIAMNTFFLRRFFLSKEIPATQILYLQKVWSRLTKKKFIFNVIKKSKREDWTNNKMRAFFFRKK